MKIVILAGGKGTRLWPLSRDAFPKQFLQLGGEYSLLQKTLLRFLKKYAKEDLLIVTSQPYYHMVRNQCLAIEPSFSFPILIEPEAKNTAPAIALAVRYLEETKQMSDQEIVLVSSSDAFISPDSTFLEALAIAEEQARQGVIVTFGAKPSNPETGYGYLRIGPEISPLVHDVEQFIEKPSSEQAQQYVESDKYLWNCGLFLFQVFTFWTEAAIHFPLLKQFSEGSFQQVLDRFIEFPNLSIDYALMEKSKKIRVVSLSSAWADIGSWDSIYESFEKDQDQNVKIGNVIAVDTKGSLIFGGKRLISTLGLEEVIVIETADAVFLGKKGESQKVKQLVEELHKNHVKESREHLTSYRPWGCYTILEESERYKIKKIVVDPLKRLSLQMHYHRSEHWVVVKGHAKVTIAGEEKRLQENESIFVPKAVLHRLENIGIEPLELIEVQSGEYVGEDDIVRFEDDYERIEKG